MLDAYLYDGLRTPIGRHAGKLACIRPDDLAGVVIAEVVKRNGVKPEDISDVILGCVTQAGEDCRNVARFAALMSGLPPPIRTTRSWVNLRGAKQQADDRPSRRARREVTRNGAADYRRDLHRGKNTTYYCFSEVLEAYSGATAHGVLRADW